MLKRLLDAFRFFFKMLTVPQHTPSTFPKMIDQKAISIRTAGGSEKGLFDSIFRQHKKWPGRLLGETRISDSLTVSKKVEETPNPLFAIVERA